MVETGREWDVGQDKGAARGRAKRLRALSFSRPATVLTGRRTGRGEKCAG
jgi:hypothetical protein